MRRKNYFENPSWVIPIYSYWSVRLQIVDTAPISFSVGPARAVVTWWLWHGSNTVWLTLLRFESRVDWHHSLTRHVLHCNQTFLQPALDSGDAARVRAYTPLLEWWRCVCTTTAVGASLAAAAMTDLGNLCQRCHLDRLLVMLCIVIKLFEYCENSVSGFRLT